MKKLIKTIEGAECKIFAIKNHQRLPIGEAMPIIEIYQNVTEVRTLSGRRSQCKTYEFSLIICSDVKLGGGIQLEVLDGISCFDIKTLLKRKDDVFVPFEFASLVNFNIDSHAKWIFDLDDYELTKKLIEF